MTNVSNITDSGKCQEVLARIERQHRAKLIALYDEAGDLAAQTAGITTTEIDALLSQLFAEQPAAQPPRNGFFAILSLHRDDLTEAGFDGAAFSDEQMRDAAHFLSGCYEDWDDPFQDHLNYVVSDIMDIPRLKES